MAQKCLTFRRDRVKNSRGLVVRTRLLAKWAWAAASSSNPTVET
jgi:hypothetical protein